MRARASSDLAHADRHTEQVRRLFDRQSRAWASQYASGLIADRQDRFLDVLRPAVPANGAVLDLGCGSGDITLCAAAQGWRVTGCDLSPGMIEVALARLGSQAVSWVVLPKPAPLPFSDSQFDAVYSSSVLEYVGDPLAHLLEVARVLRPQGFYAATVPDMRHPVRAAERAKHRLAAWRPVIALLKLTRWGAQYEYLRTSINRFEIDRWTSILESVSLAPGATPRCEHPLALLVAQKIS